MIFHGVVERATSPVWHIHESAEAGTGSSEQQRSVKQMILLDNAIDPTGVTDRTPVKTSRHARSVGAARLADESRAMPALVPRARSADVFAPEYRVLALLCQAL